MFGEDIHHDRKGEDVAPHDQNKKDKLSNVKCRASDSSNQEITSISHAVNVHMTAFELPKSVCGICRDDSDSEDGQDAPRQVSSVFINWGEELYGTRPSVASAFGSERTPSDMVSAIMTGRVSSSHPRLRD
jgi:hypothetical protein